MPLCTRYATSVSRKPNHSLSSRSAKYDSESAPYRSTMNRARSRDSGRYDDNRGETAGRNSSQQNDERDADADREQRRRHEPVDVVAAARRSCIPTSRSRDRLRDLRQRQVRVPQRDADRPADDRDRDPRARATPTPRRHDDGLAGAAKSSRWTTRKTTTSSATIASSTSRPLMTLPTTATSSSALASSHACRWPRRTPAREQEQTDAADRDERGGDLRDLDRREPTERGRGGTRAAPSPPTRGSARPRTRSRPPPIRRVRRRSAVASPADGQVTVPGCSATSAGGQHGRMRSRDAIRSSSVRSGRSRAPCQSRDPQLRARLELDPRTPQPRRVHRGQTAAWLDPIDGAPRGPAVRVERAAAEVGELGPARVAGDQPRAAARREPDRDTAGRVVVAQRPRQPRDRTERVVQLRDDERQRDRDEDELDREARRPAAGRCGRARGAGGSRTRRPGRTRRAARAPAASATRRGGTAGDR